MRASADTKTTEEQPKIEEPVQKDEEDNEELENPFVIGGR